MKASKLMLFTKDTIYREIPEKVTGVIYLRGIADEQTLYPIYYVSKAQGNMVKEQLLTIFNTKAWHDALYINYIECSNEKEAYILEQEELKRFSPKYNKQLKQNRREYISSLTIEHNTALH